ncbi:hypothetical protein ABPG72_002396 [Tetrahymena utriculariae]
MNTLQEVQESNFEELIRIPEEYQNKLKQLQKVFEQIYQKYPFKVSNKISKDDEDNDLELGGQFTYGEIEFVSLGEIFYLLKNKYGVLKEQDKDIFYDLGSGSGKPTIAAALLHQFKATNGIELLKSLVSVSNDVKSDIEKNQQEIQNQLNSIHGTRSYQYLQNLNFQSQDFLQFDWSNADLVFVNATCYDPPFLQKLYEKSLYMKKNSIFITTTRKLPVQNQTWQLLCFFKRKMDFGNATIHIYQKLI